MCNECAERPGIELRQPAAGRTRNRGRRIGRSDAGEPRFRLGHATFEEIDVREAQLVIQAARREVCGVFQGGSRGDPVLAPCAGRR